MKKCEEIVTIKKKIALSTVRYEQLKSYIETYLGEKYPQFEKEVVEKIGAHPEELNILFQQFPDLKTSEAFENLIQRVSSLSAETYNLQLRLEEHYQEIRSLRSLPWVLGKIKPYTSEGEIF